MHIENVNDVRIIKNGSQVEILLLRKTPDGIRAIADIGEFRIAQGATIPSFLTINGVEEIKFEEIPLTIRRLF